MNKLLIITLVCVVILIIAGVTDYYFSNLDTKQTGSTTTLIGHLPNGKTKVTINIPGISEETYIKEEYTKYIYHDLKDNRIVPLNYNCEERPGIIHPTIEGKSLQEIHNQMIKEIEEVCG